MKYRIVINHYGVIYAQHKTWFGWMDERILVSCGADSGGLADTRLLKFKSVKQALKWLKKHTSL